MARRDPELTWRWIYHAALDLDPFAGVGHTPCMRLLWLRGVPVAMTVIIASERLDDDPRWEPVPDSSVVVARLGTKARVSRLFPSPMQAPATLSA